MPGPIKIAIGFQALAGIASGLGTVGRTVSIELAPIVVVLPLGQTTALFTLLFSLLFLGQSVEQITWRLAVGAVFVVTGSALVIIGQNL